MEPPRHKRYAQNIVAFAIVVAVITYVVFLLAMNYRSSLDLQHIRLEEHRQETEKRTTAVSYFFAERKDDLVNLALSREMSVFFENKALGMSMEYGLNLSLPPIADLFSSMVSRKKIDGDDIYERIVFMEPNGAVLVDSAHSREMNLSGERFKNFLEPESDEGAVFMADNGKDMLVSVAYHFKNRYAGQIIAWIKPQSLYKHLLSDYKSASSSITYLISDDACIYLPLGSATPPTPAMVTDFSKMPFGKLEEIVASHNSGENRKIIAIRLPVKNTPFSLVRIIASEEVYGRSNPRQLFLGMGLLAVIILSGGILLLVLNTKSIILHAHLEESLLREGEIQEKNLQLEEEIAERKKAEEALRQSEEKYRVIIENMQEGYVEVDLTGRLTFFNEAAQKFFGYSKEEMLGMHYKKYTDKENSQKLFKLYSEVYKTHIPPAWFEWEVLRKDGIKRTVEGSASLISDAEGLPLGFRGLFRDITERKFMEDALRESRQLMFDIIDFLPDATYAIDQDGKVIAWNRAIEKMTGIRAADMIGKGDYEYAVPFYGTRRPVLIDLVCLPERDIEEKYSLVKKDGDVLFEEADVPLRGVTRTVWGTARPLYDSRGNIVGAIESIRDISERKQMEETVKWLAFHDGLTGLPNRRLFSDRLTMALAHVMRIRKKLCVLIFDLDRFKHINDTHGHPVGDSLLQEVAKRLSKITRQEDTIARLGGDEFILLLPQINHEADVTIVMERIMGAFQQPFNVDGHEFHITVSIGFAIHPDDGEDAATLIKNADIAMYIAKEQGRNRYQRFLSVQNK